MIFGAKLWVIARYGNITPFWDQWRAEGELLYEAFHKGTLTLATFFRPHNEHRILFTRLLDLFLFILNGYWDPIVQMVINAVLHSTAIVIFAALCAKQLEGIGRVLFVLFTGLVFAMSFGAENTLCSFQSQFYFASLFGVLLIWLTWKHDSLTRGWWLGILAGVCGMFSLASALCALLAATLVQAVRWWLRPADRRRHLTGMLILLVLALASYLLVPVRSTNQYTLANQLQGFGQMLAWPGTIPMGLVLVQAPFVVLAVWGLRRRLYAQDQVWLLLAFGAWGWLEALVVAHGRGTDIAGRYTDFFSLTLCAQFAALCWQPKATQSVWCGRVRDLLAVGWCAYVAAGMATYFPKKTLGDIAFRADPAAAQQECISTYLATKKVARLEKGPLPHSDLKSLRRWLNDPDYVNVLPTEIRPPLACQVINNSGAFLKGGRDHQIVGAHGADLVWGSYDPNGQVLQGEMTLAIPAANYARRLEFYVAGNTSEGQKLNSLTLTDGLGHLQNIALPSDPAYHWTPVLVKVGAGPLLLHANAASSNAWFAFTEPREIGPLSQLVRWITPEVGVVIAALGVALMLSAAIKPAVDKKGVESAATGGTPVG